MAQRLISHIFFVTLHSQIRDVRQSSIDTHYLFRAIHCHSQIRWSDREPASQTLAICFVRYIATRKFAEAIASLLRRHSLFVSCDALSLRFGKKGRRTKVYLVKQNNQTLILNPFNFNPIIEINTNIYKGNGESNSYW